MDQHKLRSLVFEKTGVRIDVDDPIFALVALNEAVLAETVERHVALIDAASQDLVRHARAAGGLAPAADGAAPRACIDATNEAALGEAATTTSATSAAATVTMPAAETGSAAAARAAGSGRVAPALPFTPAEMRLLAAAAGISLLSALLVLGGQALFFKPPPAPVPVPQLQAKTLTPEQTAAIATADKLGRAMQKLDPKSRSLLQAELQKP